MERFWDCARECVPSPAPSLCLHSRPSQQSVLVLLRVLITHTHTHTPQYIYPTHILHPHTCPQRHFHSQACTPKCILIHTHLPTHIPPTPIHTEMHTWHIHPQVFTYIPCLIHFTPSKCPPVTSYKYDHRFIPWGSLTHKTPFYTDTAMHTQSHAWPSYTLQVIVWDSSHPPCI